MEEENKQIAQKSLFSKVLLIGYWRKLYTDRVLEEIAKRGRRNRTLGGDILVLEGAGLTYSGVSEV